MAYYRVRWTWVLVNGRLVLLKTVSKEPEPPPPSGGGVVVAIAVGAIVLGLLAAAVLTHAGF